MKNAIKIAIENGGYKAPRGEFEWNEKTKSWWYKWEYADYDTGEPLIASNPCIYDHIQGMRELVLDPLFWKALGRGLGWEGYNAANVTTGECEWAGEWISYWHEFIDHLAEGKDIDSFFADLIK